MADKKDYIDLRDQTEGNGPPPVAPVPAYIPPTRKGNGLIILVVVLSALLVFAMVASVIMGFVIFRNVTDGAHTQFATEVLVAERVEDWARQVEIEVLERAGIIEAEILERVSLIEAEGAELVRNVEIEALEWALLIEERAGQSTIKAEDLQDWEDWLNELEIPAIRRDRLIEYLRSLAE